MRSYYEHLETAMGTAHAQVPAKPVVRSSAIFPVINTTHIHSRILFMGYWILKRNIREILAVINLRDAKGQLLGRQTFTITESKTFRVELQEQLTLAGISSDISFTGSLEVEFFSTVNLVFPYPATVINYYGDHFSTVVHTAQRIYNDFEDKQRNTQTQVPESGFNIYADQEREPFIGLINGAQAVEDCPFTLQFINSEGESLEHRTSLGRLAPYETRFLYPAQEVDLQSFLKGKVGAAKAFFHVDWIFPRLVVGNIQRSLPALVITHTYYDTTAATSESDYWRPSQPEWYPASLMVPCAVALSHFTNIYFYPIYSPAQFTVDVEFYLPDGTLLAKHDDVLLVESPSSVLKKIELKSLVQKDIPNDLGARIIARTVGESRLPARIKLGFDVGNSSEGMPCNICTNLQPFNPDLESKPRAFRWGPVLADQPQATLWIMNSAPHKSYTRQAEVNISFHREQDATTLTRQFTLPPHGFRVIKLTEDEELRDFFQGQVGWYTATIGNPYATTFYFAENLSGIVGGDHGF